MNKIFFLLFFYLYAILGAEKYNVTFKKISYDPSDIKRDASRLLVSSCDEKTRSFVQKAFDSLKNQSVDFDKKNYCFDSTFETAVCLQGNGYSFQIPFYDKEIDHTAVHHQTTIEGKPLCVAVSGRFIFYLSANGEFCFINVPQELDQQCSQKWIRKTFKNVNPSLDYESQIYCFPGASGQFYLTHDEDARKDLFLLAIKEKSDSKNIVNTNNNDLQKIKNNIPANPKKGLYNWFFAISGLGVAFGIVVFIIQFKSKLLW